MAWKGCELLALPCAVLIALIAFTLGLLIEADRQGVHIPHVSAHISAPLRRHADIMAARANTGRDDDAERVRSLLAFLDSGLPPCSAVPAHEIDECAVWQGCMLALGMDEADDENIDARARTVESHRDWSSLWSVSMCGKQFTAAVGTWIVSPSLDPLAQSDPSAQPPAATGYQPDAGEVKIRQAEVKAACLRTWQSYRKLAWGSDELLPLSRIGHRYRGEGMGIFLLGAMETLWMLGEKEEFDAAVSWVVGNSTGNFKGTFAQAMNIDQTGKRWPAAEIATHVVGGLLSAHSRSGYPALLDAADAVGGRLEAAFRTRTGLPLPQCDLGTAECQRPDSYPHNPRGDVTVEETWAVSGLELAVLAHVSNRIEQRRHRLGRSVLASTRTLLDAIDQRAADAQRILASERPAEDNALRISH